MCDEVPACRVGVGGRMDNNDKRENGPLQCGVKSTMKERKEGDLAWGSEELSRNLEGPTGFSLARILEPWQPSS